LKNIYGFRKRRRMDHYERRIESFYQDLARTAKKIGYKLHLVKEEAYHIHGEYEDFDYEDQCGLQKAAFQPLL